MTGISFPITISEMSKMHEDGDIISLYFSRGCLGCFLLIFIMWFVYYLSSFKIFKDLTFASLTLSVICFFMVYIYRPIFLSDETRKKKGLERVRRRRYKALDKLEGADFEEAIGNLPPEERDGYLAYPNRKKISTKVLLDWVTRDRKRK